MLDCRQATLPQRGKCCVPVQSVHSSCPSLEPALAGTGAHLPDPGSDPPFSKDSCISDQDAYFTCFLQMFLSYSNIEPIFMPVLLSCQSNCHCSKFTTPHSSSNAFSSLLLRVEQRSVPPEWQHFFLKRAGRGPQRRLTPTWARKLRAFPKFRSVFVLRLPSQVQVARPTVTVSHGGPTRHWHSRMCRAAPRAWLLILQFKPSSHVSSGITFRSDCHMTCSLRPGSSKKPRTWTQTVPGLNTAAAALLTSYYCFICSKIPE